MDKYKEIKKHNLTIGADPELAFWCPIPGTHRRIEAYKVINPGSSDRVAILDTRLGTDARAETAELRVQESTDPIQLARNIGNVITGYIKHKRFRPTYYLDWYADNRVERVGGHIHFGHPSIEDYDEDTGRFRLVGKIARHLDTLLSVPLMMVEDSRLARERKGSSYGSFLDIRPQPYGFEYRTPPSFLATPELTTSVLCLAYAITYDVLFNGLESKLLSIFTEESSQTGDAFRNHTSTIFSFMLAAIHQEVRHLSLYPLWKNEIEYLFTNAARRVVLTRSEIKRSWGARSLDMLELLPSPDDLFKTYQLVARDFDKRTGEQRGRNINTPVFRTSGGGDSFRNRLYYTINGALDVSCKRINEMMGFDTIFPSHYAWSDRTPVIQEYTQEPREGDRPPSGDQRPPFVGHPATEIILSSNERAYLQLTSGANSFWDFVREDSGRRGLADYFGKILQACFGDIKISTESVKVVHDYNRYPFHRLILPRNDIGGDGQELAVGLMALGCMLPIYRFTRLDQMGVISAGDEIADALKGRVKEITKISSEIARLRKDPSVKKKAEDSRPGTDILFRLLPVILELPRIIQTVSGSYRFELYLQTGNHPGTESWAYRNSGRGELPVNTELSRRYDLLHSKLAALVSAFQIFIESTPSELLEDLPLNEVRDLPFGIVERHNSTLREFCDSARATLDLPIREVLTAAVNYQEMFNRVLNRTAPGGNPRSRRSSHLSPRTIAIVPDSNYPTWTPIGEVND
jgi:hypothetical protein